MNRLKRALKKARILLFKGAFIHNPVLTQIIGICPIVACAKTFRDALALSLLTGVLLIFCEGISSLALKKVTRWVRVALYALICSLVTVLIAPYILPVASDNGTGLGIYIYLIAVNGITVTRCERFACKNKLHYSLVDAAAAAVGFGTVACTVGIIREVFTYGSVYIFSSTLPRIPNASLPFIALIILGFLAAAHKAVVRKFYPDEETDTFSMRSCEEKITLREPGLGKKKPVKHENDEDVLILRPRYTSDESDN